MKPKISDVVRLLLAYIADQRKAEAVLTAKLSGYGRDRAGRRKP